MAKNNSLKQLAVIGAGPGGYAAAFHAADLGLQVTLIDPQINPGGVCLYRGCIPTKVLLHIAKVITEADELKNCGVEFPKPKIDIEKIRDFKTGVVKKLSQGLGQLCRQRKVEFIQGIASFTGSNALEVKPRRNGTQKISFDHAILATGSCPATIPNIPCSIPAVMDSSKALQLTHIPESLLVVGGGYIGLELGSFYTALGTKVSVVELTSNLMPGSDLELVSVLSKRLQTLLTHIMLNTTVAKISEQNGMLKVIFEGENLGKKEAVYEKVLVAVGRKPNSGGISLENTKAQLDEKGFVRVDRKRQTDDESIYAVGDVAGQPLLAHKASHEGMIAAKAIAGLDAAFEPQAIPFVIYTEPEVAECGLSESQAKYQNRAIKVAKFPWQASGRAATMAKSTGLTKLIIDPATDKILGAGIVGTAAGELIAEAVLAVQQASTAQVLASTIHAHPTLSETLMEAAEVYLGQCIHLYRPRRP
jgi:dihydrolipoamide dehydrogenase